MDYIIVGDRENLNNDSIASKLFERLLNSIKNDEIETESENAGNEVHKDIYCDFCKKANFPSYRYKCLICDSYDLCSTCFENNKSSHPYSQNPLVRFDKPDELFGVSLDNSDINLLSLLRIYAKETPEGVECNACSKSSIKGLRFKCTIKCVNYDLCAKCYVNKKESKSHKFDHVCLAIGKSTSLFIKPNRIELLGEPLGRGAFGAVYKAKLKPQPGGMQGN
jgi:hypothetical protein